jgi:hypothetical protein
MNPTLARPEFGLHVVEPRNLGQKEVDRGVEFMPLFSAQQLKIIRLIAITSASISITFALIATYWFFRMKRKFRHLYDPCSAFPKNSIDPACPKDSIADSFSKLDHEADRL